MNKNMSGLISRILSIVAAVILLQTLYFKFTAHPDSVYIFSQLGLEPYGRIGIGVAELITAILLLWGRTQHFGALLGLGIISGAIFSHITKIGIVVGDDGGLLFTLAIVVFVASLIIVWINRKKLPVLQNL